MEKLSHFENLTVWKKSHELVLDLYKVTALFPKEEVYGLTSQIKRAAVSVPANIAEGFVRRSRKDKVHFYNMAQSSLSEIQYYLILIRDLGFLESSFKNNALRQKAEEVAKMLNGLITSIDAS